MKRPWVGGPEVEWQAGGRPVKASLPLDRPTGWSITMAWHGCVIRRRRGGGFSGRPHEEFYRHGYRAGSLNGVVERAGVTKGAMFHHFPGKQALVLALIDEKWAAAIRARWVEPLGGEGWEPLAMIGAILAAELEWIEDEGEEGWLRHGCPVANLAADAAGVDELVRERLDGLYREWREALAGALERGRVAGSVHPNVVPEDEAAFLVAALSGIAITGKVARDVALLRAAFRAAAAYLETLRAPESGD